MMNALLIITTGQTDVQLVQGDVRQELEGDECGSLHDQIERRSADWRLADDPATKLRPAAKELPQGIFALCTPKLNAVLRYATDNQFSFTAALILETRRTRERRDPRFAGAILEQRMQEWGICDVCRCAYLKKDDKDYADKTKQRDAVIRREVVACIDEAIRNCLTSDGVEVVVLATTGGFPAVNRLVDEIVRLHAPSTIKIDPVEVEDRSRGNLPQRDAAVSRSSVPEPSESFRARKHALDLVGNGNLLGALGAVQHLHRDPVERRWTRAIEWLACFAASQPVPQDCDIPVLIHHRMAVRAALRVELALRAGDIPRAVHGTVAFFECALWDHLGPHLTCHGDPKKRRLYKVIPLRKKT